ncbi:hypothetical protein IKW75_02290 [Candidatus Saccharibacteria bacterium]|nr:hypothetical protein [Candidatus Saccharibacteria bacterium]
MRTTTVDIDLLASGKIGIGDFMSILCQINDGNDKGAIKELDMRLGLACEAKRKTIRAAEKDFLRKRWLYSGLGFSLSVSATVLSGIITTALFILSSTIVGNLLTLFSAGILVMCVCLVAYLYFTRDTDMRTMEFDLRQEANELHRLEDYKNITESFSSPS